MCQKTKLLHEKECRICKNPTHLLFFRQIENKLVYYFAKCTKCNYSYRANMTMSEWQEAQKQNIQLQQLTRHHRKPKSHNGSDDESNISIVPEKKHQYFHGLFGTDSVHQIAKKLNEIWIDPAYKLLVIKL